MAKEDSQSMKTIKLKETDSTNKWVLAHREELEMPVAVYAESQTSGRGQRGNSWESEPGKNLTVSVMFSPLGIDASRHFLVSEAVSLAVCDVLKEAGVDCMVKWPNDVYAGDRKISGILIENSLLGHEIKSSVAGVGINLNQEEFLSDAPNPVSVIQLTGKSTDVDRMAREFGDAVESRLLMMTGNPSALHEEYKALLWRKDGEKHGFFDRKRDERIRARIRDVKENGILVLELTPDENREYLFKEVEFIL